MPLPCRSEDSVCIAGLESAHQDNFDWARLSGQCGAALCAGVLSVTASAAGTGDASAMRPGAVETVAQVQSLDRFQAEQERMKKLMEGKPKAYEDKVMDPSTLPNDSLADDALAPEADLGLRTYSVESRFGLAQAALTGLDRQRASEWGFRGEFRSETLSHGEWVLQADTRSRQGNELISTGLLGHANDSSSGRLTIRNLGFPLTPSLFADTSVGDIYSEITDGLARSYRLSLGSSAVRGLGTRIFSRDIDLRAGLGERGAMVGGPFPGFERSQGTLAWAGYTQRFSDRLFAAVQVDRATGVRDAAFNPYGAAGPFDDSHSRSLADETVQSAAAAFGYGYELLTDGSRKARLSLLRSQASSNPSGRHDSAHGMFLEGGVRLGRYRHEFGVYSAGPKLRFGDYTLASDNRGGYWRVDHDGSRLNWGGGLDYEQVSARSDALLPASTRTGLSGNAQYRLDRESSWGGNFSLAQFRYHGAEKSVLGGGSRSINASIFYATRFDNWGRSRLSATVHRNEALVANGIAATGDELQFEHDWITGKHETMRPEFTTTLGLAHDRSGGETQTYPTAGLVFRYWADADWNLGGHLRYTSRSGNLSTSRGLSGSLQSEHILGKGWRLGAALSLNQAVVQSSGSSFSAPQLYRSNDRSLYVYLRWEGAHGTPYQSLGLRNPQAAGAGSVSGVIYLDRNRDGEQQADEAGVPLVEVFLDQRYRVTTDREGRFEFPLVATGRHQLSLRPESIPLPWGAAADNRLSIDVPLRGQATARIPVVRVGD
ncbi:MAG: hypothetical protein JWP77_1002 [Polaromonas sp.]|nr:hypothetical protein [Polaromonas sp.]MDB5938638.1 hypothetical protein [Polaromonas sp.]